MIDYKYFKCLKCGRAFRVMAAGLRGEAFKTISCSCGSAKITPIDYQEYNIIASGKKIRRKEGEKTLKEIRSKERLQRRAKSKKEKKSVVITRLFELPSACGTPEYNSVSSTIEKREEATKKEETKYGKSKKKKRKSSDSGRSHRVVVTR